LASRSARSWPGRIAQYAPAPLRLSFVVYLVLVAMTAGAGGAHAGNGVCAGAKLARGVAAAARRRAA